MYVTSCMLTEFCPILSQTVDCYQEVTLSRFITEAMFRFGVWVSVLTPTYYLTEQYLAFSEMNYHNTDNTKLTSTSTQVKFTDTIPISTVTRGVQAWLTITIKVSMTTTKITPPPCAPLGLSSWTADRQDTQQH